MQSDPDARGLERGAIQRHGEDEPLGSALFRRPHDVRQLRSIQPARRHPRRGFLRRGNQSIPLWVSLTFAFFKAVCNVIFKLLQ